MSDPIDDFLASMGMSVNASNAPAVEGGTTPPAAASSEADLFSGSEPVAPAPAAPAAQPAPEVPAASAPAIVADVANTSIESALAECIRRVLVMEAALRRLGIDLS